MPYNGNGNDHGDDDGMQAGCLDSQERHGHG